MTKVKLTADESNGLEEKTRQNTNHHPRVPSCHRLVSPHPASRAPVPRDGNKTHGSEDFYHLRSEATARRDRDLQLVFVTGL